MRWAGHGLPCCQSFAGELAVTGVFISFTILLVFHASLCFLWCFWSFLG